MKNKNVLVAYFSHTGNNWVDGKIVDLKVGNTKKVADKVVDALKAKGYNVETFEIKPVETYPSDYKMCCEVAKIEKERKARPELIGKFSGMKEIGTVVLGFPNWWDNMPMPVFTFLDMYDFSNKNLVPFCTNEGSGLGDSVRTLRNYLQNVDVFPGVSIRGSKADDCDAEVAEIVAQVEKP